MHSLRSRHSGSAVIVFVCFLIGRVAAQDAAATAVETMPPALKTYVKAEYPAAELEQRREGTVGLELDIDASGHITVAS